MTTSDTTVSAQMELFVKMAISAWKIQNERVDKLLATLSDEQLAKEIAPGKNTGTYLVGHLVAVSDGLFPLFELGQRLYPQLEHPFIKSPDKAGLQTPSMAELRSYWTNVNRQLSQHFDGMSTASWLAKHTAVSAEDFAKEPHRNKLNVLLNRTSHQAYHIGQLILLK